MLKIIKKAMVVEITLLIKSIMGLIVILSILIFLMFYGKKSKKQKKEIKSSVSRKKDSPNTDLEYLKLIIKKKKTTDIELQETLDLVIKYHGVIHKKLGLRAHPDFDTYMDILFTICRHPNTTKDIIIKFDKELTRLNPQYKPEINDAITKGLNSRGV